MFLLLAALLQSPVPEAPTPGTLRGMLTVLASDSFAGRLTGTEGARKAATWIAEQMRQAGLEPAGDSGYFQRLPLAVSETGRLLLAESFAARDTFPSDRWRGAVNVVGIIRGADPALRDEVVLVTAHYDHVGIRAPVDGDSIYNGADDNASGTVTILEIGRLLRQGPPPARTVVIAALVGEEVGALGSRWYIRQPVRPMEQTVANFNVEMVGRPDSLAGGPGRAWLTGYERSTMGDALRQGGIAIVPDPRPEQNFFRRSDNYRFALAGIPAHTLSSFNLHSDYHRPGDEADRLDYDHMAAVVAAAERAVRILTDGPRPAWKEGGRPTP